MSWQTSFLLRQVTRSNREIAVLTPYQGEVCKVRTAQDVPLAGRRAEDRIIRRAVAVVIRGNRDVAGSSPSYDARRSGQRVECPEITVAVDGDVVFAVPV